MWYGRMYKRRYCMRRASQGARVLDKIEIVYAMVGCCDTFHDFKSRTKEGTGLDLR